MKEKAIYLTLLLAAMVTFGSCSSDDDAPNNPLVGTWSCVAEESDSGIYLTLNSDGTCTHQMVKEEETETLIVRAIGNYAVNSDTLEFRTTKYEKYGNASKKWIELKVEELGSDRDMVKFLDDPNYRPYIDGLSAGFEFMISNDVMDFTPRGTRITYWFYKKR